MPIQHLSVTLEFDRDDSKTGTVFNTSFDEKSWVAQVAQKVHSLETIAMYWKDPENSRRMINTYSINPDRSFGEPVTQLGFIGIWFDRELDVGIMHTHYDSWSD